MKMFNCPVGYQSLVMVSSVIGNGNLSEGEQVKLFEQDLAKFGLRNPVCTNSGTSALHLGLVLAGVEPGDEVILPAQTFIATGMAVLMCGATPVFADIDPTTGNLEYADVVRKITLKTRAVIPVHWLGLPCDMNLLCTLKGPKANPIIVADAAHAFGAEYKGNPVSDWADLTMHSFQSTKHVTCGDGGCLAGMYDDGDDVLSPKDARRLRWFGIDRNETPNHLGVREEDINELSFKYHMNDVAAAIGLGSLQGFPERLKRRQEIGARYRRELYRADGVKLLRLPDDRTHTYYAFGMLVERRDNFARAMQDRGVPCSVISRRIDTHSVFGSLNTHPSSYWVEKNLPGTDVFDRDQICLPCHPGLTDEDVTKVVEAVKAGW